MTKELATLLDEIITRLQLEYDTYSDKEVEDLFYFMIRDDVGKVRYILEEKKFIVQGRINRAVLQGSFDYATQRAKDFLKEEKGFVGQYNRDHHTKIWEWVKRIAVLIGAIGTITLLVRQCSTTSETNKPISNQCYQSNATQ